MMKKYKFLNTIITATILVLITGPAQSATITYIQNNSYLSYCDGSGCDYSDPSIDPTTWAARSSLDPTEFSDSASMQTNYIYQGEETQFAITFSLDETTNFSLTGSLYQTIPDGSAWVSLYSYSAGNIYGQTAAGGSANISFSQTLGAGEYGFVASATAMGDGGSAGYGFLASINNVPLPTTVWLFGSGLIGLIGIARKRKTSLCKS